MSTVGLPTAITPPTCAFGPSNSGQTWVSLPARHAGLPPISTVGQPGPGLSGVPWLVMSPARAAGCPIVSPQLIWTREPLSASVPDDLTFSDVVASIATVGAVRLSF